MSKITIIGGGLAGLVSAILLKRQGVEVVLYEKKQYPFHRVCGEYISNEVRKFMDQHGFLPGMELPDIQHFELSSISGKAARTPLDLGGFGISRYTLDNHLYELALSENIDVQTGKTIKDIQFHDDHFHLTVSDGQSFASKIVIGAFGKRSNLDKELNRSFFKRKSPYIGVKYHAKTDHPSGVVALHNFMGGYCGLNQVENGITNICYLSQRDNLKKFGAIPEMEIEILHQNPNLKRMFSEAEFLFDKPEVINEISFETKNPVEQHVLMCGDAAGMITPLCGNGMAMAIHSAKILSEEIGFQLSNKVFSRADLEQNYTRQWESLFKRRLWIGRKVQKLFGNRSLSNASVRLVNSSKSISRLLIRNTHGSQV